MTQYLDCLKKNSSNSSECRPLNRDYLNCRMQKYVIRVQLGAY
jgi:cytochrome c oxidase assembly protein subunit 19